MTPDQLLTLNALVERVDNLDSTVDGLLMWLVGLAVVFAFFAKPEGRLP